MVKRTTLDPSSEQVIVARGLTKSYGDKLAVDGLSFSVGWGKVTGFLGPNGAGKTTTLRMVLGLVAPSRGSVTILGGSYPSLAQPLRQVGALLDAAEAHPLRSGLNHLRVLAGAAGIDDARVKEVLGLVGLGDAAKKKVGQYSLGMKQRLGLAAALLGDPRVLILDEPANGLDPAGIKWLRELLRSFAENGGAVFVSSHQLGEVSHLADEVVVINHGSLVTQKPIDELVLGRASVVRAQTPQAQRLVDVLASAGLDASVTGAEEVTVSDATAPEVGTLAFRGGVVLYGLQAGAQNLEEAFFALTGGRGEEGTR